MKIIICGYNGKMGQAISNAVQKYTDCKVIAGVDISEKTQNSNCPIFKNLNDVQEKADVIIDFSNPAALNSLLDYSLKTKTPAVICTTGFSDEQINKIKETSKFVPIFYSQNMSLGINLILELSKMATKILGNDFDIEIIEKHHHHKIDAPSGTALMIANEISSVMEQTPEYIYDRTQKRAPRTKNEIGIHSVRGGSITGDHEVLFAGEKEVITISHHAESREIFANGAIKAAYYLISQSNGLYSMKDMINN